MGDTMKFVATCSTGVEDILSGEIEKFGGTVESKGKNTVSFYGSKEVLYKMNMASRVAVHILKYINNFFFKNTDELYEKIKKIEWERYFDYNKTIRIDLKGNSKHIANSHFGVLRIKDAVVDRFRELTGERPSISRDIPDIQITVFVDDGSAIVYIDSSGLPLFKRGYRLRHGDAPIKEDLAAGILLLSGYDGTKEFLDPMSGSGTFLFEAYMIACNIAPNLNRIFAFMNWKDYDPELLELLREKLKTEEKRLPSKITGFEKDGKTAILSNNIKKDFFNDKNLRIMTGDFTKITENFENVIIVTNPPYGERIKTDKDISDFYADMGDFFKQRCKDSVANVFTANLEAAKSIGLRCSSRIKLYNGPLEARLLRFDIY